MHTRCQLRKSNILEVGYAMLMLYFFKGIISLFIGIVLLACLFITSIFHGFLYVYEEAAYLYLSYLNHDLSKNENFLT